MSTPRSRRWRSAALLAGVALLALLWLGPLPQAARSGSFTAHMLLHMALVTAVPVALALAVVGSRRDPVRRRPALFAPLPVSALELAVVWAWHAPALHRLARDRPGAFALEQALFLGVGLWLWLAVLGGAARRRAGAATLALLLTSMHMTLLGALLALAPRPLFDHLGAASGETVTAMLRDQQRGGALMLLLGGAAYLLGGLVTSARMLRAPEGGAAQPARRTDRAVASQ